MSRTKRPIKTTETVILVILAAGLVFLGVKLFQLRETDRQYRAIEEAVGTEDGLSDLAAENREVIAWLRVDGTAIDYPVTQAGDNIKYVGTDVKGKSSFAGNPFLDHRNDPGFTDVYSIIYGHDMEDHLMFGDLTEGDQIYRINGKRVYFTSNVSEFADQDPDGIMDIELIRDGKHIKLKDYHFVRVPYETEDGGQEMKFGIYFRIEEASLLTNAKYSLYNCFHALILLVALTFPYN